MKPRPSLILSPSPHAYGLASAEEMRLFDQRTIDSGTAARELMERAGNAVFLQIKERCAYDLYSNGKIVIFCGTGNNGGDGLVVARLLRSHGYEAVAIIASALTSSAEFNIQLGLFTDDGGVVRSYPSSLSAGGNQVVTEITADELATTISHAAIIIDAMLGTAQKSEPRGALKELVTKIVETCSTMEKRPHVIALDTPTGINTDTGALYEPHLNADLTVCIELLKRGLMQYPARDCAGDIVVVPIQIECGVTQFNLLERLSAPALPIRSGDAHKGDFGRILIIGGSENMPGAPLLSAEAALHAGCGAVVLLRNQSWAASLRTPEIMFETIPDQSAYFGEQAIKKISEIIDGFDCLILGPGIGNWHARTSFLADILALSSSAKVPVVLDADGLNGVAPLSRDLNWDHVVITPHPGEAARLLSVSTHEIQSDRYASALRLHQQCRAQVVLKGASTVIYGSSGGWVNSSGNAAMACSGSGDALCGLIASLIAQGLSLDESTRLGVYVHGVAGDRAVERIQGPLITTDMISEISGVVGSCTR